MRRGTTSYQSPPGKICGVFDGCERYPGACPSDVGDDVLNTQRADGSDSLQIRCDAGSSHILIRAVEHDAKVLAKIERIVEQSR